MLRTALALALAGLAVAAGPAGATTASYSAETGLDIQGTDGPDFALEGANDSGDSFVVFDPGPTSATVVAGAGCSRSQESVSGQVREVVKCPLAQPATVANRNVTVRLGAGNDIFFGLSFVFGGSAQPPNVWDGGAGDDEIRGRLGFERLIGGEGNDRLFGMEGNDVLEGGPGNDQIDPGSGNNTVLGGDGDDGFETATSPGADVYSGGGGTDAVGYPGRSAPITVSPTGPDGQAGENDDIKADVERVTGGSGNDNLVLALGADPLPGLLDGGAGDDTLRAVSKGLVTLRGGTGTDKIPGSAGPEGLETRDGVTDGFSCGGEVDTLDADLRDKIPLDCEKVTQGAVNEGPNVRIRTTRAAADARGAARVRLACPRAVGSLGCKGALRLQGRARGRAARYTIRAGRSLTVRAALAASDARLIARRRRVLRAVSVERGRLGAKTTISPVSVAR